MDKILVSACLLGDKTTYKGGDNAQDYLAELNEYFDLVPFCPEVEGGLKVPRKPSEIRGSGVYREDGVDVTKLFQEGAYKATQICSYLGVRYAIMKENSPSCGPHHVYDGYFHNRLIEGEGVTVTALRRMGVEVLNEEEGRALLERCKKEKQSKDEKTRIAIAREENKKSEEATPNKPVKAPYPRAKSRPNKPAKSSYRGTKPRPNKSFKKDGAPHKGNFHKKGPYKGRKDS